ncbi:hypothetical protein PR048_007347 [Dryococelus australis]|uniref:Uncharacterized protein n=1 Tax=Dryococelus australis TaxID=614101 RepID=A0ABQ9IDY6_9NEOP|nr:hypothetical protein PR048_007347 [Dryococelus australis]
MAALAIRDKTLNRNVAKLTALKVKQELLLKDVWEAVIGYGDAPNYVLSQEEPRRCARNNVTALIFKYVGENFVDDIADIESAKEAWAILEELCNNGGS